MTTHTRRALLIAAAAAPAAACATRRELFTADEMSVAHPVGFGQDVRVDAAAIGFAPGFQPDPALALSEGIDILALSGGGAQGAYGAGVIAGWTASGTRPTFPLVTGVSAGGLIAPFAFLGPAYDDRLRKAFVEDPLARHIIRFRGVGALTKSGVFSGEPLRALIQRYADADLVAAVARADAEGRRLMIATTAMDSQRTTVWNMGAIARRGGPEAVTLFQEVLLASASIPAGLPPVQIAVQAGAHRFTEMHVDGSTTSPFFTVPESLLLWTAPGGRKLKGRLWVVMNAQVKPTFRVTPDTPIAVAKDSLLTLDNAFARTSLAATAAFCRRNGLDFHVASVPPNAKSGGLLDFSLATMEGLFEQGLRDGRSGKAWTSTLEDGWLDRMAAQAGIGSASAAQPPGVAPGAR